MAQATGQEGEHLPYHCIPEEKPGQAIPAWYLPAGLSAAGGQAGEALHENVRLSAGVCSWPMANRIRFYHFRSDYFMPDLNGWLNRGIFIPAEQQIAGIPQSEKTPGPPWCGKPTTMNSYRTLFAMAILGLLTLSQVASQERYLLVLDVQDKFYDNTVTEPPANELLNNINLIINNMHPDHVVYIKASGKVLTISRKGIKAIPMEQAPEMDGRLKIVNDHMFTKFEGDAFSLDSLNGFLAENNVKEVVIVGLYAEKCVYSTALGGIKRGYDVFIVPEAIMSRSKGKKEKAIEKMVRKEIKLLPIREMMPE